MKKEMDKRKEVEIELDFPIQLADRLLCKVIMRRPVMRDFVRHKIGQDMNLGDSIALVADLCGLVPDEMEDMDTCDFEKLQNQLLSFRGVN